MCFVGCECVYDFEKDQNFAPKTRIYKMYESPPPGGGINKGVFQKQGINKDFAVRAFWREARVSVRSARVGAYFLESGC